MEEGLEEIRARVVKIKDKGLSEFQNKNYDKAFKLFKQALELLEIENFPEELKDLRIILIHNMAICNNLTKKYEEALQILTEIDSLINHGDKKQLMKHVYQKALAYLGLEIIVKAWTEYNFLEKEMPHEPNVKNLKAILDKQSEANPYLTMSVIPTNKDLRPAGLRHFRPDYLYDLVKLEKYCSKNKDDYKAMIKLAGFYCYLADNESCIKICDEILAYKKHDELANEYKQICLEERNKWVKEARQEFNDVSKMPDDKVFYRWKPITAVESKLFEKKEFYENAQKNGKEIWAMIKADQERLKKFIRLYSIKTGEVEGVYIFEKGVTESLLRKGYFPYLIRTQKWKGGERDPNQISLILQSQEKAISLLMDLIGDKKIKLTKNLICDLHNIITEYLRYVTVFDTSTDHYRQVLLRRGAFKIDNNSPRRPDGKIHQYSPPWEVENELEKLLMLYEQYMSEKTLPAVVIAAFLHHRFTHIHPFQDGNGRIARLICSIPLLIEGLPPFVVLNSREQIEGYMDSLNAADFGNLEPFVKFMLNSFNIALDEIK